jgi:hypothetical protein
MGIMSESIDAAGARGLAGRIGGAVLWFTLGLGCCLAYLNTLAPATVTFWNREFYAHVQNIEREVYDREGTYALVFGASVTSLNLVPDHFASTLREKSLDLPLYNLGIPGARGHEVNYYLRRTIKYLETHSIPLPDYVLIDCQYPFWAVVPRKQRRTLRAVEWHDFYETLSSIESTVLSPSGPVLKIMLIGDHIKHMLTKYFPVGRVINIFSNPIHDPRRSGVFFAGYHVMEEEARDFDDREFAAMIERQLRRLEAEPDPRVINLSALLRQMRFLVERDIIPVYFLPPSFGDSRNIRLLEEKGILPYVCAFDHPRANRGLWRLEDRHDFHHLLGGEPTLRFTAELANDMHAGIMLNEEEYVRELNRVVETFRKSGLKGLDESVR